MNPTTCFAAGYTVTSGADLVVQRWNGTNWTSNELENPSGFNSYLTSISCVTAISCAAVGYVGSDLPNAPLEEHWNGKTWSITVGTSSIHSLDTTMTGVSSATATSCLAVGSGATARLWNGKSWTKIASPTTGVGSVSCVSTTNCLAVGGAQAQQWNGKTWTMIPGPNPAGILDDVSCVNATTCFSVGSYAAGAGIDTLVEKSS